MDDPKLRVQLEQLHQKSFAWALRCCSENRTEAEEVLQTAYLKILQGRAIFAGKSSFKTWLFAVIRKTAADFRRRERLRTFRLNAYRDRLGSDPPVHEDGADTMQLFKEKLTELPRRQQQVLELVFYHDLTLEQTAEVLGISLGSVRKHYDRGKSRMRRLMKESGVRNDRA